MREVSSRFLLCPFRYNSICTIRERMRQYHREAPITYVPSSVAFDILAVYICQRLGSRLTFLQTLTLYIFYDGPVSSFSGFLEVVASVASPIIHCRSPLVELVYIRTSLARRTQESVIAF
jgi:hypothetical protein